MEQIYKMIEQKIKQSGYPGEIKGCDIYHDLCDQMDDKENGDYILMSKFTEDIVIEYKVTIMDEEFNLSSMIMKTPEGKFSMDFDA